MGIRNYIRDIYWQAKEPFLRNSQYLLADLGSCQEIIFVCKGNICRSPFAEAYAMNLVRTMKIEKINVTSGGLCVHGPTTPPNEALEAAETFGISLANHRSRPTPMATNPNSSLFIAMEWAHIVSIQGQDNWNAKQRVYPLASFDPSAFMLNGFDRFNINDPYGKPLVEFIKCYERITNSVKSLLLSIQNLNF